VDECKPLLGVCEFCMFFNFLAILGIFGSFMFAKSREVARNQAVDAAAGAHTRSLLSST